MAAEVLAALAERTRQALASPDPQHHAIVVVEPDGRRPDGVGLAYGWIERRGTQVAYLLDLFVPEPQRGSGLADLLLDLLMARAQLWRSTRLEFVVGRANQPAQDFFRRRGAVCHPDASDTGPMRWTLRPDEQDERSTDQ